MNPICLFIGHSYFSANIIISIIMDQVQIQRLRNVFFCFGSNIWTKTLFYLILNLQLIEQLVNLTFQTH